MLLPSCTGRAAGRTRCGPDTHGPTSATSPAGTGQNPAPDPRPPGGRSWRLLRPHTAAGAARKTGRWSALAGAGARPRQLQQKPGTGALGLMWRLRVPPPAPSLPLPFLSALLLLEARQPL